MSQEISKLYIELPGDTISGSMTSKNMILLHEHRDVIIKIDFPSQSSFRLVSTEKPFYDPKTKKQRTEYPFSSGEEIHVWLSKFHKTKLVIEKQTQEGWKCYSVIDPLEYDRVEYLHLLARPAPIIIKVGLQGGAIGETVTPTKAEPSIPPEYLGELAQAHKNATLKAALLHKWDDSKFLSMSIEEEMRMFHGYPPEPEYSGVVEIQPFTELYRALPNKDTIIQCLEALEGTRRLVADALIATLGAVAENYRLAKDLIGAKFHFEVKKIGDGIKKFIIFEGYAGLRHFLNAAKYGVANVKVATITANHLTMGELAAQSAQGLQKTFAPGVPRKVFLIGIFLDTAQWLAEGKYEVERLFARWTVTLVGTVVTATLAPFIAAGVGGFLAGAGFAIVFGVGATVLVVGVLIGYALYSIGAEDTVYNLYKKFREEWSTDLATTVNDEYNNYVLTGGN
jgi:hypothetical protein